MALNERGRLGREGEELACRYLEKRGYKVKERNYCCRLGEIDVVAIDGKTIVFVEVRTKNNILYGTPADSINYLKKEKIRKAASFYLLDRGISDTECRFDVVAISRIGEELKVELFCSAFV